MQKKMETVLYEDQFVVITNLYITIQKYYFPLATSKTIMFSDIEKITIEDGSSVNHRWGPSASFLNNWFHLDNNRKKKTKFLSIHVKGNKIKPSATPQDVDKAFDVLKKHFAELERKSVLFESNRDKATELAQKQVDEMKKNMNEDNVREETKSEMRVSAREKIVVQEFQ